MGKNGFLGISFNKTRRRLLGFVTRWQERMERIPAFLLIKHTFLEFSDDEAMDRAGAVAYYAILSIFPLLLGVISLLGFILPSENVYQRVSETMRQILPSSVDLVEQNINNIIRFRGLSGTISLIALLWSGSSLFSAIGHAINRAWGIKQERKFYIRKLREIGMVLVAGILFLVSMFASIIVNFVGELNSTAIYWITSIGSRVIAFFFALLVFLLVYKYMPNTRTTWRSTWPGALLAASLFEIGRFLFIIYLTRYANYELIYGSLASVIILLFWIYISAAIMILGIEFNSEFARMRLGSKHGGMQ